MTELILRFFGHVLKLESFPPGLTAVRVDQGLRERSEKMICSIILSQILEKPQTDKEFREGFKRT
jgi:hypothetical protein